MEVTQLIFTILAALAAVATVVFTWGPWNEWRQKPSLSLRLYPEPVVRERTPDWVGVEFQLGLVNGGRGPARSWRVTLRSPSDAIPVEEGWIELPPGLQGGGAFRGLRTDGTWMVEWWAAAESEAVPARQDRPLPTACEAVVPRSRELYVEYSVHADRMHPVTGGLVVRHLGGTSAEVAIE
jgi:hypothetical protein